MPKLRRPSDVNKDSWEEFLKAIPAGAKFLKQRRGYWWRDFYFQLAKPLSKTGLKRGDTYIISVTCGFRLNG